MSLWNRLTDGPDQLRIS